MNMQYTVKIVRTDARKNKGKSDIVRKVTVPNIESLRVLIYKEYFRNAELRNLYYSANVFKYDGKTRVEDLFVLRPALGFQKGYGELTYMRVDMTYWNTHNAMTGFPDAYKVDKKTGEIIGKVYG